MPPTSQAPLRVAVLLDSPVLPAWLHRALWDVARSDSAELVLAVLRGRSPARPPLLRAPVFRAYESIDRRFFHFPQDHAAPIDATPLLDHCPRLDVELVREGRRFPL